MANFEGCFIGVRRVHVSGVSEELGETHHSWNIDVEAVSTGAGAHEKIGVGEQIGSVPEWNSVSVFRLDQCF